MPIKRRKEKLSPSDDAEGPGALVVSTCAGKVTPPAWIAETNHPR